MSGRRALTEVQARVVMEVAAQRRIAMAAVKAIPTNAQLAAKFGCSQRVIERVSINGYSDVSLKRRSIRRSHPEEEIAALAEELREV